MTVHLIFPPHWLPVAPYPALPTLASALERAGIAWTCHDLAAEGFQWLARRPIQDAEPASPSAMAMHVLGRLGRLRPADLLDVFRDDRFFLPDCLLSSQNGLDWWLQQVASRFPDLLFDRYRMTPREGSESAIATATRPSHPYSEFLDEWVRMGAVDDRDIVGISVTTEHQILAASHLGLRLRESYPSMRLVVGGALLARLEPRVAECLALGMQADALVIGDGSRVLPDLVRSGNWGHGRPLRVTRVEAPTSHFGALSVGRSAPGTYLTPVPILPLVNARGCCWGRCAFCSEADASGGVFVHRPTDEIVREISVAAGDHPGLAVQFNGEGDTPERVFAIAAGLKAAETHVAWSTRLRVHPALKNPGRLATLAESGCRMIVFGVESLDDTALSAMNKGYSSREARDVLAAVGRAGIWRHAFVLLGHPGSAPAADHETVRHLRESGLADSFQCSIFRLERQSPLGRAAGGIRFDTDPALKLGRSLATEYPWAFGGSTREWLLVALGRIRPADIRSRLDAYLR